MSILKAKHLSKSFGEEKILNDVSLSVERSELIAIKGSSGAGKTTLLNILSALDRPDNDPRASLELMGVNLLEATDRELARLRNLHVGFVFQFHGLLEEFSALENIMMPGRIARKPLDELKANALELISFMGLSHRSNHKPSALSGGECQRVAVARALILEPDIVFADEPSGNLDSKNAWDLLELFQELRLKKECSFVMVTHDEHLAKQADRMIELSNGKLVDL